MVGNVAGQMREGGEVVERHGEFGRTAKAVTHHAAGPGRIGGAGANHAGDSSGSVRERGASGCVVSR